MYKPYTQILTETKPDKSFSPVSRFLSDLVFLNQPLRLGIVFTSLISVYSLALAIAPWELLQIDSDWRGLYSWFFSCFSVAFFDRIFLSAPLIDFRHSFLLTLKGEFDRAIEVLDKISPASSTRAVRCPPLLYNLQRAFISLHAGALVEAENCLEIARKNGLEKEQFEALRIELLSERGDFELVDEIYKLAEEKNEADALLTFQYGLSALKQRSDWPKTKKIFLTASTKPSKRHFSRIDTSTLAVAFVAVSNLWTGRAEQGLDELNLALFDLSGDLPGNESLRPITSLLHLERALYLATHKEPEAALKDLRFALKQCKFKQQLKLAQMIVEELSWRHPECEELPQFSYLAAQPQPTSP